MLALQVHDEMILITTHPPNECCESQREVPSFSNLINCSLLESANFIKTIKISSSCKLLQKHSIVTAYFTFNVRFKYRSREAPTVDIRDDIKTTYHISIGWNGLIWKKPRGLWSVASLYFKEFTSNSNRIEKGSFTVSWEIDVTYTAIVISILPAYSLVCSS